MNFPLACNVFFVAISRPQPLHLSSSIRMIFRIIASLLFLRIGLLRVFDTKVEPWMMKLTTNLLMISTHKNLTLSGRSLQTSPKTRINVYTLWQKYTIGCIEVTSCFYITHRQLTASDHRQRFRYRQCRSFRQEPSPHSGKGIPEESGRDECSSRRGKEVRAIR